MLKVFYINTFFGEDFCYAIGLTVVQKYGIIITYVYVSKFLYTDAKDNRFPVEHPNLLLAHGSLGSCCYHHLCVPNIPHKCENFVTPKKFNYLDNFKNGYGWLYIFFMKDILILVLIDKVLRNWLRGKPNSKY